MHQPIATLLKSLIAVLFIALPSVGAPLDAVPQTRLDANLRCLLGVYSLPSGRSVIINGVGGQPRGLQYTLSNGQFETLQENADGSFSAGSLVMTFSSCAAGQMMLKQDGKVDKAVRLRLIEKETEFVSDGIKLHGKLVLPPNGRAETAAVWIEGSNNDPSTDDTIWQYELARRGIAVFVYDKRGTGASAGALSSDFQIRARDTVAAVKEARRLAPGIRRIGIIGGSQGGWVAPLTAKLIPLDFVISAFAMAEGPIAQDRELVEQQLRDAGFDGAALLEAKQLTSITERIVRSNMNDGFADLDAFKTKYASAPWMSAIQPRSYTGLFLKFSSAEIKSVGPSMAQGLAFDYEPLPVIEAIQSRQLWLLGGSDRQAPNAATQVILRQLQQRRRNIAVVVFPDADHGLIEQIKTPEGLRSAYSAKLFDVTADWIKAQKLPSAEKFIVMPKAGR
jgi:uncharacterized protein